MAKSAADKSDQSTDDKALEKKVDTMMKPDAEPPKETSETAKLAEQVNKQLTGQAAGPGQPVQSAGSKPKTAPELSPQLTSDAKTVDDQPADSSDAGDPVIVKTEAVDKQSETFAPTDKQIDSLPEDPETDKAVDDIVAKEGDTMLALQDARTSPHISKPKPSGWRHKIKRLLKSKKTWLIAGGLLIVLLAVPLTRYKLAGLVYKAPVSITVVDSKTNVPVSNAVINIGGASGKTDAEGVARFRAPVGSHRLTASKQYYKTALQAQFIGFKATPAEIKLDATGRLVPISVTNKIDGKPIAGASLKVLKSTVKTDKNGQATIALPAKDAKLPGRLSLAGYNDTAISVSVIDKKSKANTFAITPAGHIYFLSNLTGTIDVVRANLDGTDRKTILKGTGNEDRANTSLLASRDWRYLVLKARRDKPQAALYLIDTRSDKISEFDSGNAEFELIGWHEHDFVYAIQRQSVAYHQAGRQILKSYDAHHQQLRILDQNQAQTGNTDTKYAYQNLANYYIVKDAVVYTTQWFVYNAAAAADLSGKSDTIRAISPGGQNKKDHHSFATADINSIRAVLYAPQEVYFAVHETATNKNSYYEFENGSVKPANTTEERFNQNYPTFLISPSGNRTFWSELRDGKNSLFTGNLDAEKPNQLAALSDYTPYGWHSDSYLLLAKNSSELYIATPDSLKTRAPHKITDYYKPDVNYRGYGYGYGGL